LHEYFFFGKDAKLNIQVGIGRCKIELFYKIPKLIVFLSKTTQNLL